MNETERWTIINALHVAAVQYEIDAQVCQEEQPRTAMAFRKQCDDCIALANKLESED